MMQNLLDALVLATGQRAEAEHVLLFQVTLPQ
jgi:hypothetical protein